MRFLHTGINTILSIMATYLNFTDYNIAKDRLGLEKNAYEF